MVIYLCFSKVKAENGAHVEYLSINTFHQLLATRSESIKKQQPEESRKLPVYKWIYDFQIMLPLGIQKVKNLKW